MTGYLVAGVLMRPLGRPGPGVVFFGGLAGVPGPQHDREARPATAGQDAGLDADARPDRQGPPLGAQAAPPAPARHRGPARAREPPPAAAPRGELALGCGYHRRDHPPAGHPVRLTSRNSNHDAEGEATRARGTPPTRRDSRAAGLTRKLKLAPGQCLSPPPHERERSRLGPGCVVVRAGRRGRLCQRSSSRPSTALSLWPGTPAFADCDAIVLRPGSDIAAALAARCGPCRPVSLSSPGLTAVFDEGSELLAECGGVLGAQVNLMLGALNLDCTVSSAGPPSRSSFSLTLLFESSHSP